MRLKTKTFAQRTAIAMATLATLLMAPAAMAKDHKPQGQYWPGPNGGPNGGPGGGGQWGGGQGGGQWGNGGQWNNGPGGHDWDDHHRHHGYPAYYYAPRYRPRVIYVPAPVYYAPPPPVYYQPAPVYYQPEPVYVQPPQVQYGSGIVCTQSNNGAIIGATAGGVIGGVLGNQSGHGHDKWAATAGGSILGVLLGGAIGQTVDSFDRSCAAQAVAYAPVGQPVEWRNQNYGREYQVVPMREYQSGGQYCREYQATANIDGRWQQVHGTACMQPDGSWAVAN